MPFVVEPGPLVLAPVQVAHDTESFAFPVHDEAAVQAARKRFFLEIRVALQLGQIDKVRLELHFLPARRALLNRALLLRNSEVRRYFLEAHLVQIADLEV